MLQSLLLFHAENVNQGHAPVEKIQSSHFSIKVININKRKHSCGNCMVEV